MMNPSTVSYLVSKLNFIPTVQHCFQNEICSPIGPFLTITIVTVVTSVRSFFISHRCFRSERTVHFILYEMKLSDTCNTVALNIC